jgi:hypothetical protein
LTVAIVTSFILVSGCGGDDDATDSVEEVSGDDSSSDAGDDVEADDATDDAADDATDDGGDDVSDMIDDLDFGDGMALVTIGDAEYEFALGGSSEQDGVTYIGVCQTLFGLIAGNGYDTQGRDITIAFEVPPPDWETYEDGRFDGSAPSIEIEIDQDGGWLADMEASAPAPGTSQLDEWESDGTTASGTATFIEVTGFGAPVEGAQPVSGTFQLGCGDS